jgi:regulator of protease activity HflC (stomatin/prohibitin superfamily)
MEAAFAWIQQLWTFLVSLVPHLIIVRSTHGGVKYVRGKQIVELKPGIRWYWPIVTETETQPSIMQSLHLTHQILTTADGKTVYVAGLLMYEVVDMVAYCTKLWDADQTIDDISAGALREVVAGKTLEALLTNNRGTVDNALTREAGKLLGPFGTKVHRLLLTDLAPCRVVALIHQTQPNAMPVMVP